MDLMRYRRILREARGQALMDYIGLVLLIVGLTVWMMHVVVPVFKNQFMRRLISVVVNPFIS